MVEFLNGYSDLWIYALLFFLLFLCGIGFPMAEELVLLAGGVLVAAAEHDGGLGEVFFLGGTCHTWREFGHEIGRQMGIRPRELRLPQSLVLMVVSLADGWARVRKQPSLLGRANLLERLQPFWVCDRTKAMHAFGPTPRTRLTDGIAQTLRWYQQTGWL